MNVITTDLPRFMIAGTNSGAGKTTVTCAILKALQNRGLRLSAFKCGPDYIDPMFHTQVIGTKSRNLDLYMCDERTVRYLFAQNGGSADVSVIEGVMGLYDGLDKGEECSSNHLARVTATPTILVLEGRGASLSLAAKIYGFLHFRPNNIKGVILNKTAAAMYPVLKEIIERELPVKVYGYMPPVTGAEFASRHLGLVTAGEIADIRQRLELLAAACEQTVDLDGLLALAKEHAPFNYSDIWSVEPRVIQHVRIGVARDKAFCFYYEDNLALLENMGARLEYFSPLADSRLPEDLDGLILSGGYPEEYARILSGNAAMLNSVKQEVNGGLPTIAECGGFMYLCRSLANRAGVGYKMAGVIDADCVIGDRLSNFGYIKLTAQTDNLLCRAGESINAHEFHYSTSSDAGSGFTAGKADGRSRSAIHATATMFAGYPHIHFWGNRDFARNFIEKCHERRQGANSHKR